MSRLLPPGVDSLADCPYTLHDALVQGLHFLRFEELPRDEQPPRNIWLVGEAMDDWWAQVERRRRERYGDPDSGASGPSTDNPFLKDFLER